MDPIKILKRAWHILWSYRALWVFGLILAMAGAGSSGGNGSNSGSRYEANSQSNQQHETFPEDMPQTFEEFTQGMERLFNEGMSEIGIPKEDLTTLIWIAVIFVVFSMILGLVVAVARYVAETAVIRMVDEYENTGSKMTVREGFRIGWSRTSWRLFLINLLVNLPMILTMLLLLGLGIMVFMSFTQGSQEAGMVSIVISAVILFLVIFVVAIVSIFLGLLRHFFWRACALENLGVRESLSRGFQMARENWKNVGIMWLVMIGLGIVWAIVSIIAFIVTIPVVLVTAVVGALVAVIPVLLAGGLTSIFLSGWLPWVIGVLFALPLFFTIAFSPWLLLGSWQTVYASTVWTLVYRELKALPALTSQVGDATPLPPVS
ncbi:hypothetical protein [Candidatus Villigracilis affinis]|uniref:DUF7544 domain-containing protein n=1 Tax=Candidatus Villigracilis affinis TaxID=3140682 RepID=UPI002A1FA8BD|nr:hypothetical protein [Anaerolineales bacterium]